MINVKFTRLLSKCKYEFVMILKEVNWSKLYVFGYFIRYMTHLHSSVKVNMFNKFEYIEFKFAGLGNNLFRT